MASDSARRPMWSRVLQPLAAAVIVALSVAPATAAPLPATWDPDPRFPDFFQRDPMVNDGDCACAPVALTDSLFWLGDAYALPNLKTQGGATWQDVTNTLAGPNYMNKRDGRGTFSGSFADGKVKYIRDAGYAAQVRVETKLGGANDPPTLLWIKQQVAAGQDVEILIGAITDNGQGAASWDGGHYVAVTGWDNDGFLRIADPWTDNNNNGEFLPVLGLGDTTLDFDSSGNDKANYTQEYVRVRLADGLFEDSEYQIIFAAFAESPLVTPEPGTLLVVGSGLAGFVVIAWRRRRRRP